MKTLRITHLHAVSLSLVGLLTLAVMPAIAEEIIRWGHFWTSQSNPNNDMKVAGRREAHTVVPVRDMDVSQIAIRGGANRAGTPLFRIGIQNDDGTANHFPNGQWIGGPNNFATSAIPSSNRWEIVSLPGMAQMTKGTRYHLVIEAETADASNYSSITVNYQPETRRHRVADGVYDDAVGRETFNGTSWSRASSMPILAIDTNANKAVGQPWSGGENTFAFNQDWRYGQTFTLDVPVESSSVELLSFSLYVSTVYLAPVDDLRVHLLPAASSTPLLSMVLVDKDNLPAPGMITITPRR